MNAIPAITKPARAKQVKNHTATNHEPGSKYKELLY